MSFGVPFERYDSGEPIAVDFASAAVGHDAVAAPDFAACDLGDAGALAQRGLEPCRVSAVLQHGNRFATPQFRVKRHPSAASGPQRRMQGATPFRSEDI